MAEAVSAPAVAPQLMRAPAPPKCDMTAVDDKGRPRPDFATEEVEASRDCWRKAQEATAKRLTSLQAAVRVREKAVAKVVADTAGPGGL